jgi:hypothetical protein
MKILTSVALVGVLLGPRPTGPAALLREMKRMKVQAAIMLPSRHLEGRPVWSPDSRYVAAKALNIWLTADLDAAVLVPANWYGVAIGATKAPDYDPPVAFSEIEKWSRGKTMVSDVVTAGRVRIELKQNNPGTSLVIREGQKPPNVIWTTDQEQCSALEISPNSQLVAFLCEMNGLMVMDVR